MDVSQIADLARLALSAEEAARFQVQLEQILGHAEQIMTVDVSGIDPTAHAAPLFDVFRPDLPGGESFSQEEALSNAPERALGQFKVVKVVE